MILPWKGSMVHLHVPTPLPMLLYLHSGDTGSMHNQNSTVSPHNGAIPTISSTDAAIYASRRISNALSNPATSAPFARFGAQTMDVIRKLSDIFSETCTPTPTPTPLPRRTRATTPLSLYRETLTPTHLQRCRPQHLRSFHQFHPLCHHQGWIPQHTTHPTVTPCAHAHGPTMQWIP